MPQDRARPKGQGHIGPAQHQPQYRRKNAHQHDVKRQNIHVHRLEAKYQPLEQELRGICEEAPDVEVIGETGVAIALAILIQAAQAGIGVALLPELQCQDALRDGQLVRVLPDWSAKDGIIHLVFPSRRGMLPGVRATIDFLAAALKAQV